MSLGWIDDYELLRELDRGGMGVVFVARHRELDREVALKRLTIHDGLDDVLAARLRLEAQAVANLKHPHLVPVHAVGEHQGAPYFVMDLVEGQSLEDRLRGGALPAALAARVALSLAHALHAAHASGVVHRDLKPGNVLLRPDGSPVLIDFGLLRELSDRREELTRTGELLGTPAYMAPEQANADREAIGPRTDIYGLGATLYAMLTGQPPFSGTVLNVLNAVLTRDPVSPRKLAPVPPGLEAICLRCMAKAPRDRYASMRELAEDLEVALQGEVPSPRARRRTLAALAVGAAAIALTVGLWRGPPAPPSQPPDPPAVPSPDVHQPVSDAVSPSPTERPRGIELALMQRLAHKYCRSARFTRDGILTAGEGGVRLWTLDGKPTETWVLKNRTRSQYLQVLNAGDRVAVGGHQRIVLSSSRGELDFELGGLEDSPHTMASWQDERLAFAGSGWIYLLDLQTRKLRFKQRIPHLRCLGFTLDGDVLTIDSLRVVRRLDGAGVPVEVGEAGVAPPKAMASFGGGHLVGDEQGGVCFLEGAKSRPFLDGGIEPGPLVPVAFRAHRNTVRGIRLLADGGLLTVSSQDLAVWSREGGLLTRQTGISGSTAMLFDLDVSARGDRVLITVEDVGAELWSISR